MNSRAGAGVGGLTVFLLFSVLCLTIFSVLALSSAQADSGLTQKYLTSTLEYYAADGAAEERLMELEGVLAKTGEECTFPEDYWPAISDALQTSLDAHNNEYAFTVDINDALELAVTLRLQEHAPYYSVAERVVRVKTQSELTDDFDTGGFELWSGE